MLYKFSNKSLHECMFKASDIDRVDTNLQVQYYGGSFDRFQVDNKKLYHTLRNGMYHTDAYFDTKTERNDFIRAIKKKYTSYFFQYKDSKNASGEYSLVYFRNYV